MTRLVDVEALDLRDEIVCSCCDEERAIVMIRLRQSAQWSTARIYLCPGCADRISQDVGPTGRAAIGAYEGES